MNVEKNFAFIDCSSAKHATGVLAFMDGSVLKNQVLRVRRPKDFLLPPDGDPAVKLRELMDRSTLPDPIPRHEVEQIVTDGPNKLFIGNLNNKLGHNEMLDCMFGIGDVKSFNLIMERDESELNAGYAFVEFKESETDKALLALHGIYVCGSHWVVERHVRSDRSVETPDYSVPSVAKNLMQKASRILELSGIIDHPITLKDDDYFKCVEADVKTECSQLGRVKSMQISQMKKTFFSKRIDKNISTTTLEAHLQHSWKTSSTSPSMIESSLKNFMKPIKSILSLEQILTNKSKIEIQKTNSTNITYKKEFYGQGKVYMEFTRPEVSRIAAHHFHKRTFEGRVILCRFYPLKWYQKQYQKGLSPMCESEKIQLALETQEKLMLNENKLFPCDNLR
jgi:RNA recognition motif-containing protein